MLNHFDNEVQVMLETSDAEVWEDLVRDYLELRSSLKGLELSGLIQGLKKCQLREEKLAPLTSFMIGRKMVLIQESAADELWLFIRKTGRLRGFKI